jgi:hypothetical protein
MIPFTPYCCEPVRDAEWRTSESWDTDEKSSIEEPLRQHLEFVKWLDVFRADDDLAKRFHKEAEKWARETEHLSSPAQMMAHPSYQAILGMAAEDKREVIRLMIQDLKQNRNEWFWALSYLTQENPIKHSDAGKMDKMVSAWVNWGLEHNLI